MSLARRRCAAAAAATAGAAADAGDPQHCGNECCGVAWKSRFFQNVGFWASIWASNILRTELTDMLQKTFIFFVLQDLMATTFWFWTDNLYFLNKTSICWGAGGRCLHCWRKAETKTWSLMWRSALFFSPNKGDRSSDPKGRWFLYAIIAILKVLLAFEQRAGLLQAVGMVSGLIVTQVNQPWPCRGRHC